MEQRTGEKNVVKKDVYTKEGLTDGTYVTYVNYDTNYTGYSTPVPMLDELYIMTTGDGSLIVNSDAQTDPDISAYMTQLRGDSDVQQLMSSVQGAHDSALASDPDLSAFLSGMGEAVSAPEAESSAEAGTGESAAPEYDGPTVTATDDVYLRSEPGGDIIDTIPYGVSVKYLGTGGMSANYNQFGILKVSWANSSGICAGGQRNIGLHDAYNNIDQWGACLADLSWLVGDGAYWGTVYVDDVPVAEISSTNGFYSGYVTDQVGEVKVCGGSATADGSDNTACTIAQYMFDENANGYVDENGNWIPIEIPEYEQYGYWDENGNWVGQGHWDENGFHLE